MKIIEKYVVKKEAIFEKGMEVMWFNGYNGISVKDIVSVVGILKGLFYFYFDFKEEFVIEVLKYYLEFIEKLFEFIMEDFILGFMEKLWKLFKVRVDVVFNMFECNCGEF